MAAIRALIVDDEPLALSNLRVLLRPDPDIELVGECGSGAEAVAAIRAHRPALVFLDVQMPEVDGFDVLELLGPDAPPAIVFVTAFDPYALRAFDAGALDTGVDGDMEVVLADATRVPLSRRYRAQLQGRLGLREG